MLIRPWRAGSADPIILIVQPEYVQNKIELESCGDEAHREENTAKK
jgi:hypothetical protein